MQTTQPIQEKPTGYFLWLKLKAALAWLKRAVMAMLIAGSFYIGAAQPAPVRAAEYDVGDEAALISAINAANASPEADTITFIGDITLTGNLPLIKSDLVFEGDGYAISGNDQYRVFFVGSGSGVNELPLPTAPTVVFRNLTIQHGKAQGGNGSGGGAGLGGGMFVYDGHVTVQNVTFAHNAAQGGNRANRGGGGMGGNGGSGYGGGGGLWVGADGGTTGGAGGSADAYGGGGGGECCGNYGGGGGGSGGGGYINAGGGGGLNGGNAGTEVGGVGGFGGGGGSSGGLGLGGSGGFGGGGGDGNESGGSGGFGGGGGSSYGSSGSGGFGGSSAGGGAGLGGGLFIRTGVLTMTTVAFHDNAATGGATGGQGLGGGLFVLHTLANTNGNDRGMPAALPVMDADSCGVTFSGNTAVDAGTVITDNVNVFGDLGGAAAPCVATWTPTAGTWHDFAPQACARVWFTDTGATLPTAITVTVAPTTAGHLAGGLLRRYDITAEGGSGYQARLELCYNDAELPAVGIDLADEANLDLYRWDEDGCQWIAYSTVNTVTNRILADNVMAFGVWGIGVPANEPTVVGVRGARDATSLWGAALLAVGAVGWLAARRRTPPTG